MNKTDKIIVSIIVSIILGGAGAIAAYSDTYKQSEYVTGKGRENIYVGCKYENIMDYFPPRAIWCEILRKRWCDDPAILDCHKG